MADPQQAVPPPAAAPDARADARDGPQLVRRLGAWDGALITIGSVLGTGIFITTGDMARVLPHPGLILPAWVRAGCSRWPARSRWRSWARCSRARAGSTST